MLKDKRGLLSVEILIFVVVIAAAGLIGWKVLGNKKHTSDNVSQSGQTSSNTSNSTVSWSFNGSEWKASGTPPTCSEPLVSQTPIDITKATAILYPGQTRGGNYKPHGGFLFGSGNNTQTVKIPLDSVLYKGSRYIEQGETQYFFVFIAPCGIMYRFDHLNTLTSEFQAFADKLPAAKENDSSTTNYEPTPEVKAGDTVATVVGFTKTGNASLDFGVYDLRQKNAVSQTSAWQKAHSVDNEFGAYGICWLDDLPTKDASVAKSLPGGDATNGKTSDYCK